MNDNVGPEREPLRNLLIFWIIQVKNDRLLPVVKGLEDRGGRATCRGAGGVTGGILHFNDLGTEVIKVENPASPPAEHDLRDL